MLSASSALIGRTSEDRAINIRNRKKTVFMGFAYFFSRVEDFLSRSPKKSSKALSTFTLTSTLTYRQPPRGAARIQTNNKGGKRSIRKKLWRVSISDKPCFEKIGEVLQQRDGTSYVLTALKRDRMQTY